MRRYGLDGLAGYLPKPYDLDELAAKVKRVLVNCQLTPTQTTE